MCEKLIWEFLTYRDIIYRIILIYFHIPIFTIPKKKTTKTLESKSQLQYDSKIWIQKEKKLIVENWADESIWPWAGQRQAMREVWDDFC